uniref:MICOS complex subunit MIC10 n=1 Tax=Gouania willdenowi TaxID=441366 RepID=A0A8C5DPY5_GOUWI
WGFLAVRINICIELNVVNLLLLQATGLGVGIVFSVILFKRRTWPLWFGSGLGLGMGYNNCQHDFRSPYLVHGHIVKVSTERKV